MSLTAQDVEQVAKLARLKLSPAEVAHHQKHLAAILRYADMLSELDLDAIPPTTHAVAQPNTMRDDNITPSLTIDQTLANAAEHEKRQFKIQKVLSDEGAA